MAGTKIQMQKWNFRMFTFMFHLHLHILLLLNLSPPSSPLYNLHSLLIWSIQHNSAVHYTAIKKIAMNGKQASSSSQAAILNGLSFENRTCNLWHAASSRTVGCWLPPCFTISHWHRTRWSAIFSPCSSHWRHLLSPKVQIPVSAASQAWSCKVWCCLVRSKCDSFALPQVEAPRLSLSQCRSSTMWY